VSFEFCRRHSIPKLIFVLLLLSFYRCNLIITVFEAAQPALLYLVPACLGSSLLCATVRGGLKELFDYSEEEEEEEVEEKKDEKSKKDD